MPFKEKGEPEGQWASVRWCEGRYGALFKKYAHRDQPCLSSQWDAGGSIWRSNYLSAIVVATHPKKLEAFETLARDHGDKLHLTKKSDFGRREAGWKGKCHCCVLMKDSVEATLTVLALQGIEGAQTSKCQALYLHILIDKETRFSVYHQSSKLPA